MNRLSGRSEADLGTHTFASCASATDDKPNVVLGLTGLNASNTDAVAMYVRWQTDAYDEVVLGVLEDVGFELSALSTSAAKVGKRSHCPRRSRSRRQSSESSSVVGVLVSRRSRSRSQSSSP